jgi:ribose 5-phosphate isomerase B
VGGGLLTTLGRGCDSYLPGVRIAIASDHAGFLLKGIVSDHLKAAGHDVADHGTDSEASVDYPAFCAAAARAVVRGDADFGIVIGGSGQGEQIAANKVHGARAALCHDLTTAKLARSHNDANVLSLGGRLLGETLALAIVDEFLAGEFEGGRHVGRLEQLRDIEREECGG